MNKDMSKIFETLNNYERYFSYIENILESLERRIESMENEFYLGNNSNMHF